MSAALDYFRETHLIGRRCRERMLDSAHFPVLRNAPFIWLGLSALQPPYRMVRLRSVHSHVVVSVSGKGRALVGDRLVEWKPGQILLGPVGAHHAFEAKGAWNLAWVFFDDTERAPVLPGKQARLVEADTEDFVSALRLLIREAGGNAQPDMMASLVGVLDTCARRLAGCERIDARLRRLWETVETQLSHPWCVAELSQMACMSEEHLRRLCHKHYQRSPGGQLTHLRLRRACTMLRSTMEKTDEIARKVGYSSMYSFSTAFRRWSGIAPRAFRNGRSKSNDSLLPEPPCS